MRLLPENAGVAELVDALDLGSSIARCESSSLSSRTISLYLALHPTNHRRIHLNSKALYNFTLSCSMAILINVFLALTTLIKFHMHKRALCFSGLAIYLPSLSQHS